MSARGPRRDIQWIDGLRGIASFTVVCTHLTRAFDDKLYWAADDEGLAPRFGQWPFIRLIFQGNVGVSIFAMLTGYVCALKPLRLARSGEHDAALSAVSKRGAFRRVPRLVMPATIALIIAWGLTQVGGFVAASRSDSPWLRDSTPIPDPSLLVELQRLWLNIFATWSERRTQYDDHQWTLLPLLKGSLTVYLMIAALIYTKFRYRIAIYLMYIAYWWQNTNADTETFGQQVIWGVVLSDIAQSQQYKRYTAYYDERSMAVRIALSAPLIVSGLYLASFPKIWQTAWMNPMWQRVLDLGMPIWPFEVDYAKRFTALGVQIFTLGLQFSPGAQHFLASDIFLKLGRHSFAVYLIHGTLLRSVLAWLLYGITGQPWNVTFDENGLEVLPPWLPKQITGVPFLLVIGLWFGVVYYCAFLWTAYIDAWCGRMTQRLEETCFERPYEETHGPLLDKVLTKAQVQAVEKSQV